MLMAELCDPASLTGEGGYYLAVFDSALTYLRDINMDDELSEEKSVLQKVSVAQ
jgi:hypothetical protein